MTDNEDVTAAAQMRVRAHRLHAELLVRLVCVGESQWVGFTNQLLLSLGVSVSQIMREHATADCASVYDHAPASDTRTHPGCRPAQSVRASVCERPCLSV